VASVAEVQTFEKRIIDVNSLQLTFHLSYRIALSYCRTIRICHGDAAEDQFIAGESARFVGENILDQAQLLMQVEGLALQSSNLSQFIVGFFHPRVRLHIIGTDEFSNFDTDEQFQWNQCVQDQVKGPEGFEGNPGDVAPGVAQID